MFYWKFPRIASFSDSGLSDTFALRDAPEHLSEQTFDFGKFDSFVWVKQIAPQFLSWPVVSEITPSFFNNGFLSAMTPNAVLADLTPENVSLGSTNVTEGGSLSVSWLMANIGSGAANSTSTTELRITQSSTSWGSPSNNVGSVSTPALGAGNSVQQSDTITAPTAPGTYYVWAIADNNSQVSQSNVSNDEARSAAFTVSEAVPTLSGVSPTSYPADTSNHTMVLHGSNFVSGDTLTFIDPITGSINSTAAKLTFVNSGEIDYQFNDGGDKGTWYVEVNTADGTLHSSYDPFAVAAAATDTILDTPATTANLTMDGTVLGTIDAVPEAGSQNTAFDHDWYRVTLTAGHSYSFSAVGTSGSLNDVAIDLRDSGGNLINNTFDDGGVNGAASFTYAATSSGTYFLAISAGGNSYASLTGNYQITTTDNGSQSIDTVLDTTATSASLTMDGTTVGTIDAVPEVGSQNTTVDHDWYHAALTAGHSYTFSASGTSGTLNDVAIDLRDSSQNIVNSQSVVDSGPNGTASFVFTAVDSGTYYVAISAGGDNFANLTGGYEITATDNGIAQTSTVDTVPENTSTTFSLSSGQTITGYIDQYDISGDAVDHDWYQLSLTAGHTYHFTDEGLTGTLDYTAIEVYDSNGNPASGLADFSNSLDFTPTSSGTYYLAISAGGNDFADKTGEYQIGLTDTGAPPSDDYADDPSDTSAPIGQVTLGVAITGFIGPANPGDTYGDKDVFQVSLQAGHSYDIELKSADIDGQTLPLGIFTVRDTANFDDVLDTSSISSDTSVIFTPDTDGSYYIRVGTGGAATDEGGYSLSVNDVTPSSSIPDDYPDYPGDTSATNPIQTIAIGSSQTGVIESVGDKDVFEISVVAGHTYQLSLDGESAGSSNGALDDGYMTVRDGNDFDTVLAQTGGSADTTLSFIAQQSGTEYVRVGSGGDGTSIGGYRVAISDQGIAQTAVISPPSTIPPLQQVESWLDSLVTDITGNQFVSEVFNDNTWTIFGDICKLLGDTDGLGVADFFEQALGAFHLGFDAGTIGLDIANSTNPGETAFVELGNVIFEAAENYIAEGVGAGVGIVAGGALGDGLMSVLFADVGGDIGEILGGDLGSFIYDHYLQSQVEQRLTTWYQELTGSDNQHAENAVQPQDTNSDDFDPAKLIQFNASWYLSTYADAAAAVANGTAASAYAYFLTLGIDKGELPNPSQHITRADLSFTIINNDPNALGNSALMTEQLGQYAGDGISVPEQAVTEAINAERGSALALDSTLSAIASRKAIDLTANFATSAVDTAQGKSDSSWAAGWSNGNALSQQFNQAFTAVFGANPDSHYQMFVVASPTIDASTILNELDAQSGGSGALGNANYDTVGIGERGGVWVIIVGERNTGYSIQTPGSDTLAAITEYGGSQDDTLYAGTRAARLYGLDGNDLLVGGSGHDRLFGGSGNDTLIGGPGNDQLNGGSGNDTVSYASATGHVTVDLNSTIAQSVGSGQGNDTLVAIENLIGSNFSDTLIGNSGNNVLSGGGGNDTLVLSNGGNDTADGGDGNDLIKVGGALTAADRIDGGAGTDTLVLSGDYSKGLTLAAATMTNVEVVDLTAGDSYRLATSDANVAAGQTLTINGSQLGADDTLVFNGSNETDGHFTIYDGAGNDLLTGGDGNDKFVMDSGGADHVNGGPGNDIVYFNGNFTAADRINGGDGKDTLSLDGDYSAGIAFSSATISNIETIYFGPGYSYKLATNDANVTAGDTLVVNGSNLDAGDTLTFNGSKETDGIFEIFGGAGTNILTGGAGADEFVMTRGGIATINGGAGNDHISFGANFTSADRIDGGVGNDILSLDGDYTAGVHFAGYTVANVEKIELGEGFSYNLTMSDGNVAAGQTLSIDASGLGASDSLIFNGSHEADGHFRIESGLGADILTGGALQDTFVYASASESTSGLYDTINSFDFGSDRFDVTGEISAIDSAVTVGMLDTGSKFDGELSAAIGAAQLGARHAVLFTASSGSLHGQTFLIIDLNGTAGYQAGGDLVVHLHDATGTLTTGDFI